MFKTYTEREEDESSKETHEQAMQRSLSFHITLLAIDHHQQLARVAGQRCPKKKLLKHQLLIRLCPYMTGNPIQNCTEDDDQDKD